MTDAEVVGAAESDPDALPVTPERAPSFRPIARVKRVRERLGLSQAEFSESFGIPLGTLRDWEQHRSEPEGATASLVRAIEREPETIMRILQAAA
ncbi:MAG: helix-turn-helix domain-containing protein [Myxococcales bacterium]|nr:helix-turn-helix domain-containing protein [Myxococcales bacterium]